MTPKAKQTKGRWDPYIDRLLSHLLSVAPTDKAPDWRTVPLGLVRPLTDALAEHVAHHRAHHHKGGGATSLPPQLRAMEGWRLESLQKEGPQRTLAHALWEDHEYECVQDTIDHWMGQHEALNRAVESGDVFKGDELLEALTGANAKTQLALIASMLMAHGLDDPRRVALFNTVAALYGSRERSHPPQLDNVKGKELQDLRAELREVRAESHKHESRATNLQSRLEHQKSLTDGAKVELNSQRQEIQAIERKQKETESRLKRFERQVGGLTEQNERLQKSVGRAERQLRAAQEELVTSQASLRAATEREASLVAKWSDAVRALEKAERQIAQIPTGATAAWNFIKKLEERIDIDLTILQGHPRIDAQDQHAKLMKLERAFLDLQSEFKAPRPAPPPALIRRGPMRYLGLGGTDSIGASAYLLEVAGKRLLIDCGIRVGEDLGHLGPKLEGIGELDAVILTHAHTDHVGWLPALVKQTGGEFEIFATKPTLDLIRVMLDDSLKQLRNMVDVENLKQRYAKQPKPVQAPYGRDDVNHVLQFLTPLEWNQEVGLRGDLAISLHPAGHIQGAASVLIQGDGRKVVLSGDFADFAQLTVGGYAWPAEFSNSDLLIMESTYGAAAHQDRSTETERLIDHVASVLADGGSALIPCFALGRAQEVLTILAAAMGTGALESVPVWIDGMIERIDAEYRRHGWKQLPKNFQEVRAGGFTREDVIMDASNQPSIIVTTSGMLAGGPGVEYAAKLLPNAKNRLFFTGYLDEESPGYKLLNLTAPGSSQRSIKVPNEFGEDREIKLAMPAEKVQLSAHADQPALVRAATTIAPSQIVLVHGEEPARQALTERLRAAHLRVNDDSVEYRISS